MITLENLQERPLSYSSLKEFAKSPRHYISYLNKERKSTPAMEFGSLVHCLLLQPEEFALNYALMPNVDRRTKDGKAVYEEFIASSNGRTVITQDEYNNADDLVANAKENQLISDAVMGCNKFESEWRAEIGGLPIRGFFDGEADDYILEVKTTNDAEPRTLINDFYKRMYHIQAGLYNLVSEKQIKYLVVETTAPYNSYLALASDKYINAGKKRALDLIEGFKYCMDNQEFHKGYEHYHGNISIDLPHWVD
jgi:exodeoxyribonuclease VIII